MPIAVSQHCQPGSGGLAENWPPVRTAVLKGKNMRSFDKCPECGDGWMIQQRIEVRKRSCPKLGRVRRFRCSACGHKMKESVDGAPRKRVSRPETSCAKKTQTKIATGRKKGSNQETMMSHATADSQTGRKSMLLSIFQVAQKCGIDWQTCQDWIEFGYIPPPIIVGGLLRFRQSDLDAWCAAGCPAGSEMSGKVYEPIWQSLLRELQELDKEKKEFENE
jgi:predicted DNA-binding transcriptional regulator AlpA